MKPGKILIMVPASSARGGISNYYHVLKNEFPENVEFFERGSRTWPVRKGFFAEMLRAWNDFQAFKKRLKRNDIVLLQTTTSLGFATAIRDGMFIRYAEKHSIKTIVFFRGWDKDVIRSIESFLFVFRFFLFKADKFITLSEEAREKLNLWGYKRPILLETTLVDKLLLKDVNEQNIRKKFEKMFEQKVVRLLFISRIEPDKGIFELLKAFEILINHPFDTFRFSLTICGDGFELENIKAIIKKKNLENITVAGFVNGDKKKQAFEDAHALIFPSSHGEGMPNAVLEAMGFGLPVITTRVGGILDFFVNGRNGYFIEMYKPTDIIEKLKLLFSNKASFQQISSENFNMAAERFRSDRVSERIVRIFENTL